MAERCSTKSCRCIARRDGLCRTCLAREAWDQADASVDNGLPVVLAWLDLDVLEVTVPARNWVQQGACHDTDMTAAFFTERGESSQDAKDLCARCPVVYDCLRWVLDNQSTAVDHGTWGNTSVRQRRSIRRALAKRQAVRELLERAS